MLNVWCVCVVLLSQLSSVYPLQAPMAYPGRFLKEVSDEIAPALTSLFNASLKQGVLPKTRNEQW